MKFLKVEFNVLGSQILNLSPEPCCSTSSARFVALLGTFHLVAPLLCDSQYVNVCHDNKKKRFSRGGL